MTPIALLIILTSLSAFVVGQIFLKRAMEATLAGSFSHQKFIAPFAVGILLMTISFFLQLGLLRLFDLSYLYPFQGLSVILISIAAAVMLQEKLTVRLTIGALLISAGIVIVSFS